MTDKLINAFTCIVTLALAITIVNAVRPSREEYVVARIRIPTRDIREELFDVRSESCDCYYPLWSGGIVSTHADMTPVQLYDMAEVYTLDGGHYVLECVEIIPCIRVGRWLIGWHGVVKAQGDIIVYNAGKAYRLTRL